MRVLTRTRMKSQGAKDMMVAALKSPRGGGMDPATDTFRVSLPFPQISEIPEDLSEVGDILGDILRDVFGNFRTFRNL